MSEEDYRTVMRLWYEMYPPHVHEVVCGYNDETTDGKDVVVFHNRRSGLDSHVYLHTNGDGTKILLPFFPPRR
jgi:hypothetical protein